MVIFYWKSWVNMKRKIRIHKKSLVFKLSAGTAVVVIILLAVLITSNLYSLYVIRTNTINSAMNEMRIHIRDIDNSLNNAVNDLNEVAMNIDDITALKSSNESERYFSTMRLSDILNERINISKTTDALAIYNHDHGILLFSNSSRLSSQEKISASDVIRAGLSSKDHKLNDLWSTIEIDKKNFFIKAYDFSGTTIISLVKADTLMSLANIKDLSTDEQIVLTDKVGNPLARVGNMALSDVNFPLKNGVQVVSKLAGKYLMVSIDLDSSYARLSTILKEKSVLLGLGYIQWIIAILGIISLFLMPYIINYLNKEIIKPVRALVVGTRQLEQGNLDYQVEEKGSSFEFQTLNDSFNSMAKEIKTLKISAYEEKIELQKAELKYLQMQIRPHFFLNALTTVHSLTYKDKNEDIRKFIDALSNHLRYMFKGGLSMVPISEEIEYIKNYFCMQEIRFPNSIFYVFDVEPSIEQEQIPQFIIHTFVENSFKYAMTLEEPLSIFIKINKYILDEKDTIRIVIEDSGEGFPQEVLDKVNNSDDTNTLDGYRIGISNIKRTLSLLYGENNLLKISNVETLGGRVEILIPIGKGDKNETNNS